jgi:hypothetical protein
MSANLPVAGAGHARDGGEMDGGRLKRRLPIQIFIGGIGNKDLGRFFQNHFFFLK